MNIHTTRTGQNVTELAHSLYKSESPDAATATEKQMVAALLEAKPQLKAGATVPPGSMIMVPALPGYRYRPVSDPAQEMAAAAARQLRDVLGRVADVLDASLVNAEKSDREVTQQLEKMANGKVVLAPGKTVVKRLQSIDNATQERARTFAGQRLVQQQGIAQLEKDLAAFLQLHGG